MDNVFATFLQTAGLYESKEINKDNIDDLIELVMGNVKLSVYCKECKQERVFRMRPIECYQEISNGKANCFFLATELSSFQKRLHMVKTKENSAEQWKWTDRLIEENTRLMKLEHICTMDEKHHLDYAVLTTNNSIMKIGQYPSVADLTFPELDTYKKVMSKEDRKEFGRAIGLYASGIGAGSYVYLRRILERLLSQAKKNVGDEIDTEAFDKAHVGEKITMLSSHLPSMLTDNAVVYGILSKGIHELTEEECITYFPVLKDCLYMILDQWEDMRKREEKEKEISAALSKIATNLK